MIEKEFIKKPIKITAMQFDGTEKSFQDLSAFTDYQIEETENGKLQIPTLESDVQRVNKGDWVIKGIKGEFYPCREDIFNETYEEVKEEKDKKSLYDYKLGEINKEDMLNGVMKAPNKLVRISFTFQDKNRTQMESALKHPDFIEDDEE